MWLWSAWRWPRRGACPFFWCPPARRTTSYDMYGTADCSGSATIRMPVSRQNPVGAYRNIINGSVAACGELNGSLPHSSGLEARYCRTKGRWNHRTASICGGLTQCSDVRARPEYRAFRLRRLTPSVAVMQSTQSRYRQHLRIHTGPWLHGAPVRCVLLQRVVKAIIMVIPYVLA